MLQAVLLALLELEGSAPQLLTSLLSKGYFTDFVESGVRSQRVASEGRADRGPSLLAGIRMAQHWTLLE